MRLGRAAGTWGLAWVVIVTAVIAIVSLARAGATSTPPPSAAQVYLRDCAVCHGADGRGTPDGPTLQGVGSAAVDYQVGSGRMPLDRPGATPKRRTPAYDAATVDALVRYVAGLAPGGPGIPDIDLGDADIAAGGAIFRAQCAACHQWAGAGGALEGGNAPPLAPATPTQIAEAVRTGPGAMPVFGAQAVSDAQLVDLAGYVRSLADAEDAGGAPLWHLGPLPEGAVALIAVGLLLVALRLIGTRT